MSPAPPQPSICAVIAARNEATYLRNLLPLLASQQIDVAIIDNASTDDSHKLYSQFAGNPICHVVDLPHRGYFSLSEQLAAKQSLYEQLPHDWLIHHDADEILEHAQAGHTLRDAILEADSAGDNVLNFEEFVFLPEPGADYSRSDYRTHLLRYYFFEPSRNRLQRCWKRASGLQNRDSGGHHLRGPDVRVSPESHRLRHYIALSEEHARQKYLNRHFDPADLARGWHGNRQAFTAENLRLPEQSEFLFRLRNSDDRNFIKEHPARAHYWEW